MKQHEARLRNKHDTIYSWQNGSTQKAKVISGTGKISSEIAKIAN
jgi:hypothetical protein